MPTALFIGRFQPFHNGHLDAIKQILKDNDHVIIGIGSANKESTEENPLSAELREFIIRKTFSEENIPESKFTIIQIPDIDNFGQWPIHVQNLSPKFDKLYTGSQLVRECFEGKYSDNSQKSQIKKIEITPIKQNLEISASKIRELIQKNQDWRNLVPKATYQALQKTGLHIPSSKQ